MRPVTLTYSNIQANNSSGYVAGATGASWPLTASAAGDGLAHQTQITNQTITDHSAKTVTIVGTDADGNPQTETGNLPGPSATVNYNKFFKTITSVTPSASIGADTMNIGWLQTARGQTIVCDIQMNALPFVDVVITGTINCGFEITAENPFLLDTVKNSGSGVYIAQSGSWVDGAQAGKSASFSGLISNTQLRAYRFKVSSVTTGATSTAYVADASYLP